MNTDHPGGRSRGDRAVTAIGYWTPELVCAAAGAVAAGWWGPWLWTVPAALLVRIAADPLLRRARARRAPNPAAPTAGRARLTATDQPPRHTADQHARDDERRTG